MNELANIAWRGMELWPVALLALGLAMGGVAIFYGQQARVLGGVWRWVLPGLRTCALVAVAISILRPVLIRAKSSEEQGAVVGLFDRSMSMSAQDRMLSSSAAERGRVVGQLVALADGLGKLTGSTQTQAMADV